MKYEYNFATGTETVEIDEKWVRELEELDRQESCNNHTETRRHESYTNGLDDAEWLAIEDSDILALLGEKSFVDEMLERLPKAIDMLKPAQKEIIIAVYFQGLSQQEYAEKLGINQSNVSRRLATAEKNLKLFLLKTA